MTNEELLAISDADAVQNLTDDLQIKRFKVWLHRQRVLMTATIVEKQKTAEDHIRLIPEKTPTRAMQKAAQTNRLKAQQLNAHAVFVKQQLDVIEIVLAKLNGGIVAPLVIGDDGIPDDFSVVIADDDGNVEEASE